MFVFLSIYLSLYCYPTSYLFAFGESLFFLIAYQFLSIHNLSVRLFLYWSPVLEINWSPVLEMNWSPVLEMNWSPVLEMNWSPVLEMIDHTLKIG